MEIFKTFGTVMLEGAKDTEKSLDSIDKKAGGLGSTFGKIGKSVATAGLVMGAAITGIAVKSINAASDAEEMRSKFGVVFGDMEDDMRSWAETSAQAMGRSQIAIEGYLAETQNMLVGMGMARDGSAELSKDIVQLGSDLASFNNLAEADALSSLQSAISGNHGASKALGAVLNENTLAMAMERMEIKGKFQDLDEASKMQVRYNAIMMQSEDAIGDAVRTSGSFANQMRRLQGNIQDMLADIGSELLPVATEMLQFLTSQLPMIKQALMPVILELVNVIKQILPILIPVIQALIDSLMPILLKLIESILPIFSSILNALIPILKPLTTVIMTLAERALIPFVQLVARLIDKLLPPMINLFEAMAVMLDPIIYLFEEIMKALEPLIDEVLNLLIETILPLLIDLWQMIGEEIFPMVVDVILELVRALLPLLPPLIELIATIMPIFIKLFSEVIKFIMPQLIKLIQFFIPLIDGVVKGITWLTTAISNFIKSAVAGFPEFLKQVKELPKKIVEFFKGLPKQMSEVGKNIVKGIWDGITGMSKWLGEKLTGFAKKIIPGPIAKALGINSPSTVFAEFGGNLTEGLALGMEKAKHLVEDASDTLANAASFGAGVKPAFATATTQQIYQATRNIQVPVILNGREIARATARDMDEELADLAKR